MTLTAKVKSYWNSGISYTLIINFDIMYIHLHWIDPHGQNPGLWVRHIP